MRMRRYALLCLLMLAAPVAVYADAPQWLTLPPTPTLPKAAQSGYCAGQRDQDLVRHLWAPVSRG